MTESTTTSGRSTALSAMRVPELKELAGQLGIEGAAAMRKPELTAAIRAARSGSAAPARGSGQQKAPQPSAAEQSAPASEKQDSTGRSGRAEPEKAPAQNAGTPSADRDASHPQLDLSDLGTTQQGAKSRPAHPDGTQRPSASKPDDGSKDAGQKHPGGGNGGRKNTNKNGGGKAGGAKPDQPGASQGKNRQTGSGGQAHPSLDDIQLPEGRRPDQDQSDDSRPNHGGNGGSAQGDSQDRSGRRRRGRDRPRDRKRRPHPEAEEEIVVTEDDVLLPVAGILDVLDNYAFVRTSGYLPGANDVYVSLGQVKKYGLRRGDAITGAVRQPREGERNHRQKYNALVRLDSINGVPLAETTARPEFSALTPLYPQDRLRLETTPGRTSTRITDLVAPIGKGQRGLIVSPPKAGKTMLMQEIANAITSNNPDVHLMVVLVDERPEEVTDMERTVAGEVISSTFDRQASDHTTVAELAIERAKRLVELGQDVVVLLDSLTRLSRAYNLSGPTSGRMLSGGVDASALYPPKKFFGAARNIEHGGSLTILASALVETGSKMDEVIFEEFKGTGNMELRLSRQLADKRLFPAVDVNASGTRREEVLIEQDELTIMWKLRRLLSSLDQQQAIELLQRKLGGTSSNAEFLLTVQKTTPSRLSGERD